MSFYDAIRVGASGAADFEIERSLRFNNDDNTHVIRTIGSTSNRRTFTYSFWIKRTMKAAEQYVLYNGHLTGTPYVDARFEANNHQFQFIDYDGSHQMRIQTNRRFRDPGAWYHFVIAIDTTQSTESDRAKFYVNGEQETSFSIANYPSQNQDTAANVSGHVQTMGAIKASSSNDLDGYLAEVNFIDGQQLTPSSFAETNSDTGQWVPIDTSGLTFGTNGFRLKFEDNSGTTATTLGKDSSGNGNNFTPNNFVTGDAVKDSPTNNFCTLNILNSQNTTLSEGNLKATISNASGNRTTVATMGSKSGKWYYEVLYNSQTVDALCVGFGDESYNALHGNNKLFEDHSPSVGYYGAGGGYIYFNTSRTEYSTDFTAGDIIGVAADFDNNQIYFYKNGTVHPNANPFSYTFSDTIFIPAMGNLTSGGNQTFTANFGQDSTFAGAKTVQGNTDSRGKGDFYYAPPSGFLALCSANLPDPTILLPNQHFNTLLYSGDGSSTRSITGVGFKPDWVWIKGRNTNYSHLVYNSIVGAGSGKGLNPNEDRAEGSVVADNSTYGFLNSFDSDGFSVTKGSDSTSYTNGGSSNYVSWNWNAGDTDSKTYTVKVVSDSGNKYRFDDFGTSAVTLDLAEGGTYTFDQSDSSMSSHPMQLSTTANGTHGGGSAYSTGVTYQLDGSTVTASAFISGFSSASSRKLIITVAASAPTLYYYCYYHSGMGGAVNTNSTLGSSNFEGNTQATVKTNTTAGFSIISWNARGNSSGTYDTVGHGLGVRPDWLILKSRNSTGNWNVYNSNFSSANNKILQLSNSIAETTSSNYWGADNTTPSSTLIHLNQGNYSNSASPPKFIMYAFSEVAGYSKFGTYTGNGSTDGTFVFTGFRPAFILLKRTNSSASWVIHDDKRAGYNGDNDYLHPDNSQSESDGSSGTLDILSNGFKLRMTAGTHNGSGDTYVYFAFAESPFKNSRAR